METKQLINVLRSHGVQYYLSGYNVIACEEFTHRDGSTSQEWTDVTSYTKKQIALYLGY